MMNLIDLELLKPKPHYSLTKSQIILINIVLGSIIFFLMGAQYTNIGFHADDYGITYNGTIHQSSDIKKILQNGDLIIAANEPLDEPCSPRLSFLEVIYRPLLLFVMGIQRKLCGLNPYYFHLIHTGFHVIVSLAIFNIIALFNHPIPAAVCSLFFGLHTSLKEYFFWQCYIQNTLQAALLIIFLVSMFIWLFSQKKIWLFASGFIFTVTLFLREALLFFPIIPILGLWLLKNKQSSWKKLFKQTIIVGIFFSIPILIYLGCRLWAYPFSWEIKSVGIKSLETSSFRDKFFDILTCGFDLLGLKWLPSNSGLMWLKITILLGITLLSSWLWLKNPYKKILLLLLIATVVLTWPSWLLVHCSRYIYLGVLSLALLIGFLTHRIFSPQSKMLSKLIFTTLGFGFILMQAFVTLNAQQKWILFSQREMLTIKSLANYLQHNPNPVIHNRPHEFLSVGHRAGLKLYGLKNTQKYLSGIPDTPIKHIAWDEKSNTFSEITPP